MKKNRGLSVIEIILSVAIIAICVLAMASLFQGILRGSPDIKKITVAAALSEEAMERAMELGYNILNSSYAYIFNFTAPFNASEQNYNCSFNPEGFDYQLNIFNVSSADLDTAVGNATDYKRVEVSVKYGNNCSRSVTAVSLFTNYTN
ncbi:MAG: type II secretion system GspH family protein [Candidatus Omnitrophica bacterium]|nr:type II secretion system GspH family protein [Candidatus Omnitrophota bacterium]